MKAIVNVLFFLLFSFTLSAQTYIPDEFIVEYIPSATVADQQTVRDLYNITDYVLLGEGVELWQNIPWPLTVTENGETVIINDVEELQEYIIEIQENGDGSEGTATASINEGDPNLLVNLVNQGALYDDGTFDPLPSCDDVHNERLIGPDQNASSQQQSRIKIIIVDQQVDGIPTESLNSGPAQTGGSHGNQVYSVINNILTQTGMTDVEYLSLVTFGDDGTSTTAALIEAMEVVTKKFKDGEWSTDDRVIINFSANIVFPQTNFETLIGTLKERWQSVLGNDSGHNNVDNLVLLINSAGNQTLGTSNVFPGAIGFPQEITVAGTEDCFAQPWENTNYNATHYEIAAEAKDILTHDGSNYYLSSGTSFSSALVTAAAAQITFSRIGEDMSQVKQYILNAVDNVPALSSTVENGRVLNIAYHPFFSYGGGRRFEAIVPDASLTLHTSPNPFTHNTLLTLQVPMGQSAQVSLYNTMGQLVHQVALPNEHELTQLQWYTPGNLAKGTYVVRVQSGEQTQQQMIIKQ